MERDAGKLSAPGSFTASNDAGNALHIASLRGNEEIVRMLLAKGVDKNSKDTQGDDALAHAVTGCHEHLRQLLG